MALGSLKVNATIQRKFRQEWQFLYIIVVDAIRKISVEAIGSCCQHFPWSNVNRRVFGARGKAKHHVPRAENSKSVYGPELPAV